MPSADLCPSVGIGFFLAKSCFLLAYFEGTRVVSVFNFVYLTRACQGKMKSPDRLYPHPTALLMQLLGPGTYLTGRTVELVVYICNFQ